MCLYVVMPLIALEKYRRPGGQMEVMRYMDCPIQAH